MKNKYGIYNVYDSESYKSYGSQYVDVKDYMNEYMSQYNWTETKKFEVIIQRPSETEDERLAREKAKLRNSKIDQLLGE
jgi:predicted NAD-dependent protein-ADP-ribosyltransferase YbiA (DUF1768 family)